MTMMKMKICLYAVMSLCMLSCTKQKQVIASIDYSFKLTSDSIPSRVRAEADKSIKIRLYVHKTESTAPVNYFFNYYITEGEGKLCNTGGNLNYEVGKDYFFSDATTGGRDTINFKYFPKSFSFPSLTAPVTLNFVVKNSQGYKDVLVYKTNISLL